MKQSGSEAVKYHEDLSGRLVRHALKKGVVALMKA